MSALARQKLIDARQALATAHANLTAAAELMEHEPERAYMAEAKRAVAAANDFAGAAQFVIERRAHG